MNTLNRFFRASIVVLTMMTIVALNHSSAVAQTVTLLTTQNFSSSTFPPSSWTGGSGWYWSSSGDGGTNGSAVQNLWGSGGSLTTPSMDASQYAINSDSVWVDFDFIWEQNTYSTGAEGYDQFNITANSDALAKWTEQNNCTYQNTSSSDYGYTPSTTSSNWKHFHMLVPVADRTKTMTITWTAVINWGDSNPAIDNVTITASYVAPAKLSISPVKIDFGGVSAGAVATATVTASSVGSANLHILGYGFSGAPDYSLTGVLPKLGDSIVVGQFKTYTVRFSPITAGTRNAVFTLFTDDGSGSNASVNLTGIGLAPSVTYGVTNLFHKISRRLGDTSAVQYIPISSTGTGPLTINSVYLIGLNPDSYKISYLPVSPMAVGAKDSIGIRFTPKIEGRPDAAVVISTNALNNPLDTVTLFGVGRLAHLVVSAATGNSTGGGSNVTMMFDSVALGDSVCNSLMLHNTGSDTLYITKQVVTSSDVDYSFYPLTGSDTMLVPDQSRLVNVCFRPIKAGARLASIRFFTNIPKTYESTPRDTSQFSVAINGTGVPFGRLELMPNLLDSVLENTTDCITATLTNSGQTDLVVSNAIITGAYASEYALTWTGAPPSFSIVAGGTKTVKICFTPTDRGPRPAMLKFTVTTSGEQIVDSFAIGGFGLHMCGTPIPTTVYDTVMLGATDRKDVKVQNCGDVPTMDSGYFSAGTSTSYAFGSGVSFPVNPAGTATFTVAFSPTALGAATGMLDFSPSAITPVVLNGWGIGVLTAGANTPVNVAVGNSMNDTVMFPNNGNIPWTPGSPSLGGSDAADFTIVSSTSTPVAPGSNAVVILKFTPSKVGVENVTIDFPQTSPAIYLWTAPYATTANGVQSGSVAIRSEQDGFVLGQSYPNPMTSTAQVTLTMPNDGSVRMDLLDATGAVVRNAFSGRLSTGDHTLTIDAKGLASGTYYCVLTSGDVRLTRQIVLVK